MKSASYPPDVLQMLFYDLLRDGLPAGEVERIVRIAEESQFQGTIPEYYGDVVYSNHYLAGYALELSNRMKAVMINSQMLSKDIEFYKERKTPKKRPGKKNG